MCINFEEKNKPTLAPPIEHDMMMTFFFQIFLILVFFLKIFLNLQFRSLIIGKIDQSINPKKRKEGRDIGK